LWKKVGDLKRDVYWVRDAVNVNKDGNKVYSIIKGLINVNNKVSKAVSDTLISSKSVKIIE